MNDREHAAWQGFLSLHATLTEEIDRSLRETHGLTLLHFEVLLHLDRAPGNRMRMSDLAASVRMSQSGASRLVDRVERAGHVVRRECDADGRVLYAHLSESGKAQLLEAHPTYVAAFGAGSSSASTSACCASWRPAGSAPTRRSPRLP